MEIDDRLIDYKTELSDVDFIESARSRPGLYVGSTDEWGAFHALEELVANAVDQFFKGDADLVRISHSGLTIQVYDNGRGFPMNCPSIVKTLTSFHDKATADDHAPHIHLVLHGVGIYPINALSSRFTLQTVHQGETYEVCFQKGQKISKAVGLPLPFDEGTLVTAELDPEIFSCASLDRDYVRRRMFEAAHLFPGLTIELNDERFKTDGLMQLAEIQRPYNESRRRSGPTRKFEFTGSNDRLIVNIALIGETKGEPVICSWVNGTPTPLHGTHVKGVLRATRVHKWIPETLLVAVVFQEVSYAGPTKDKLVTSWVVDEIGRMLDRPLTEYFESLTSVG